MCALYRYIAYIGLLLLIALQCILPASGQQDAQAASRTLAWSIVDTPSILNNVIVSPSEINSFALGPDSRTFYCVDTANSRLYKSTDAGYTWQDARPNLTAAGAIIPVWHIAIAPDDVNFVVAITGSAAGPPTGGPKRFYWTTDGGNNWSNLVITPALAANEFISCLDISKNYGSTGVVRDIALGTRISGGSGRVFCIKYSSNSIGNCNTQGLNEAITSLKFSPSYNQDFTLAIVASTVTSTFLHLGLHDPTTNTTQWDNTAGIFPGAYNLHVTNSTGIINSSLQLPSDFLSTDSTMCIFFISILTSNNTSVRFIYNETTQYGDFTITPEGLSQNSGIYSIAYYGSVSNGTLLACESGALPGRGMVNVFTCSNAQTKANRAAQWFKSNELKSPSGGANSGRANGILAWGANGSAYCGTSSENAVAGGTNWAPGQWPFSKLSSVPLDESAFSRSADSGYSWNQLSLIDTAISQLSDVAALEILPETADDHSVLYLSSLNTENATFTPDSVWRSTSDPLGTNWERILCLPTSDAGSILRVNPRGPGKSKAIVFADLNTDSITFSDDEGDIWEGVVAGVSIRDLSLMDDSTMFVLEDYTVRKVTRAGTTWKPGKKINSNLEGPGHTIYTPLRRARGSAGEEEMVLIGTTGEYDSYVAWADFAKSIPEFTKLKVLPEQGDVHVAADSDFDKNRLIYAAQRNTDGNAGTIYRWEIGKSSNWDDLEPLNLAFYGAEMLDKVLYAAWDLNTETNNSESGVDRTLYPRQKVPPPPEWDELAVADYVTLPLPVNFTREPVSLKVSTNTHNTLWAIDDAGYRFSSTDNRTGLLWSYVDSIAKLGPWPTAPPTGSFIGPDTVTGRAKQIDFKWRPLHDIYGYDLSIAKDEEFKLPIIPNFPGAVVDSKKGFSTISPGDETDPSCWIAPGMLEVGRSYYWRVRGSRSVEGFTIHSPWSATMFFSVKPGFIVRSVYHGPTLLTPINGPCSECHSPLKFSWAPVEDAAKYEITMAGDPEFKNIIFTGTSTSTAYEYKDKLETMRAYYWKVKVIEPAVSDSSPVGTFMLTEAKPAPVKPQDKLQPKPAVPPASNFWIWIIIVIATILLVLINVLAFISRRRD